MGQSGAWTAEVFFDDVRVPADALIGEEGRGLREGAHRALPRPAAHRRAVRRHGPAGARRVGRLRGHGEAGRRADRPVPAGPGRCSPTCTPSCWPAAAWSARSPRGYDSGADTSVGPSSAKLFCTEMVGRARRPGRAGARRHGLPADDAGRAVLPRRPALPALRGHQRGAAGHHRRRAAARGRHAPWVRQRRERAVRRDAVGELGTALRDLVDAAVRTEVPLPELAEAAAAARGARRPAARESRASCTRSRRSTTRRSASAGTAPSTGPGNPVAPPMVATDTADGRATGRVTLGKPHEGPPGLVHGGVVATLLDHVLARAVRAAGRGGLTATLTVTYRRPVQPRRPPARHRGDGRHGRTADDGHARGWSPRTTRGRRSPRPRGCSWPCAPSGPPTSSRRPAATSRLDQPQRRRVTGPCSARPVRGVVPSSFS